MRLHLFSQTQLNLKEHFKKHIPPLFPAIQGVIRTVSAILRLKLAPTQVNVKFSSGKAILG